MINWLTRLGKPVRIALVAGAVVLLALGLSFMFTRTSAQPSLTAEHYAAAKAAPIVAKCLEENTALTLSPGERAAIELSAVSQLIDVPAGTNVDVKVATHSATTVTGSDRYPAKYGSYNFVMDKKSGGWVITAFKHCN